MQCGRCYGLNPDSARACGYCGTVLPLGASGTFMPQPSHVTGIPGTMDPTAWAANPQMSVPGVLTPRPLAQYATPTVPLVFTSPFAAVGSTTNSDAPPVSSNVYGEVGSDDPTDASYSRRVRLRAIWWSPLFDLRPELQGSAGPAPQGMPISRGPAFGAGASLIVQLRRGSDAGNREELYNYQMQMQTCLFNPDQYLAIMQPPTSITAAVQNSPITNNAPTAMERCQLVFTPPGNPIRYWRVCVVVDVLANGADASAAIPHEIMAWAG